MARTAFYNSMVRAKEREARKKGTLNTEPVVEELQAPLEVIPEIPEVPVPEVPVQEEEPESKKPISRKKSKKEDTDE